MHDVIAGLLVLVFLTSCGGTEPIVQKNKVVKDSIRTVVQYVPRDTIVVVPKDSVNIEVSLKDLGLDPFIASSASGEVQATIQRIEDTIIVDCQVEELRLKLELLDKKIKTMKTHTTVETERVEVPKRYVPWWVNILAWTGGIALVFMALRTVLKSFKPF